MMATGLVSDVEEVGVFAPDMTRVDEMTAGEVGYVVTGLKDVSHMKVGDTITDSLNPARAPLPGYREPKPMVYAGLYPVDSEDYPFLRDALEKLKLNDASLTFEPESSPALGFGFRCGFLGLLHMEIVIERLEREYELRLVATAPHVSYRITKSDGKEIVVNNPAGFPPRDEIARVEEPYVLTTILTPTRYLGPLMELCQRRRGSLKNIQYLSEQRAEIIYLLPLAEIIRDFFNLAKSLSQGYATYDYEAAQYFESDVIRLDILLGGKPVDALSLITHREKACEEGRKLVQRLKNAIPRHLFEVPIQAAIGNKVIARENIKALRKDVTAKLYGGDITRKRKLLEKQKSGKKRMKKIGKVEVPQEAFLELLKVESSP
jgi:GTP-binding protein LepA